MTNLFFAMPKCLFGTSHWLYQTNGFYAPFYKEDCRGYYLPMKEGTHRALQYFFTSFDYIYAKLPSYNDLLEQSNIPTIIIWGGLDDILCFLEDDMEDSFLELLDDN
mgnify:CR=1 FL=1